MSSINKTENAYKTIGEVAKDLDLINKATGKLQTHTIRFWETQFKQIKPMIGPGKRRYYSKKNYKIIKSIKFLLKEKGLTINGVKKILNNQSNDLLDPNANLGIYKSKKNETKNIKEKLKSISKSIRELKNLK